MKSFLLLLLAGINAVLLGVLLLTAFGRAQQGHALDRETEPGARSLSGAPEVDRAAADGGSRSRDERERASVLPFYQLYSPDARQFAANLRAAGCPEETVRDIIVAEVNKRYRAQEEALRPQPADHVPAGWSPATIERRLVERRREAGLLAARKAAMLREALGYDVPVELPLYATSTTEQRFLRGAQALSVESRSAVAGAHEHYWAEVQALQERTQGFWEPADIAELDHLKAERSAFIDAVLDDRQWTEFRLHTEPAVAGFQKQLAMAEVHEDEMRALLLAARERGVSDLGAALSGGPESTEFLSAVLGGQRATELSRLQREPELRRFYGDLKAMGVEGEFIPPRLPNGYPPYRTATPEFRGALPSAARDSGHGLSAYAGGRSDRVCHEPCPSAAGSGGRGEASSQANRAAPARGVGSGPGVIRNLECERRAAPFAGTIAGL